MNFIWKIYKSSLVIVLITFIACESDDSVEEEVNISTVEDPITTSEHIGNLIDFDGLNDGDLVDNSGIEGKRYDFWGTYSGGYGSIITTEGSMPGKTSCMKVSIKNGTTGRPGDGTPSDLGDFGGGISLPSGLGEGDEVWIQARIKPTTNMNFSTNTGALKFFRIGVSGTNGKIGFLVRGDNNGWFFNTEFNPISQEYTSKESDRVLNRGEWNSIEIYLKLSTDPAKCIRRTWVNGQLAFERTLGNHNKWHTANGWQEETFDQVESLLFEEGSTLGSLYFPCTYWNGGAPGDQSMLIQDVTVIVNRNLLTNTDEFGNLLISD